MIKSRTIKKIKAEGNTLYEIYNRPMAKLFLLGSDSSLKGALFYNDSSLNSVIKKQLTKGVNEEIINGIKFLDQYFAHTQDIIFEQENSLFKLYSESITLKLDMSRFTDNEISIYKELLTVQPGRTISYKELSEKAGIEGGARFTGNALAKNIFPIFIPCHRVIKSDGKMGNYSGGREIKEYLLEYERKDFLT